MIVTVPRGTVGLTISTTEVTMPFIVVGIIVVYTGSVPEVIVIVFGGIEGLTTSTTLVAIPLLAVVGMIVV